MCYTEKKEKYRYGYFSIISKMEDQYEAIITVVGKDKGGIVAGVATKIAELGLNIDDISQTVLDEFFTMMAVVSSDENKILLN